MSVTTHWIQDRWLEGVDYPSLLDQHFSTLAKGDQEYQKYRRQMDSEYRPLRPQTAPATGAGLPALPAGTLPAGSPSKAVRAQSAGAGRRWSEEQAQASPPTTPQPQNQAYLPTNSTPMSISQPPQAPVASSAVPPPPPVAPPAAPFPGTSIVPRTVQDLDILRELKNLQMTIHADFTALSSRFTNLESRVDIINTRLSLVENEVNKV
eukprot:NODE_4500_length_793_cov_15.018817_g3736_i0.p1 GENE.NODE_4500_length_793_cov_15.018817_g3736_i0~~NODE_4500_length_793_cov_15.018817_g3736_i0.p1  ORF type:complete len:208 (-),score=28.09 NODE_4500_length_793_cov_15.018817_g3736_i0:91-714(-)